MVSRRLCSSRLRLGGPRLLSCILSAWPEPVESGSKPGFVWCRSDGERVTRCGETRDFQGILWLLLASFSQHFLSGISQSYIWLEDRSRGQRHLDIPPAPRQEMPCPSPSPECSHYLRLVTSCPALAACPGPGRDAQGGAGTHLLWTFLVLSSTSKNTPSFHPNAPSVWQSCNCLASSNFSIK